MKQTYFFYSLLFFVVQFKLSFAQWQKVPDFPGLERSGVHAFTIGETAYLIGGSTGNNTLNEVWAYNMRTRTWTQKRNFKGTRRESGVAFALNGKGYYGLGIVENKYSADFWSYDPERDEWKQLSRFSGPPRANGIAFTIGDKAYVGAGYVGYTLTDSTIWEKWYSDFWEYDSGTDTWTRKASLPEGFNSGIGLACRGKGYAGFGRKETDTQIGSINSVSDFYEYDPGLDEWHALPKGPMHRENAIGFVLNDEIFVLGGFSLKPQASIVANAAKYTIDKGEWRSVPDFSGGGILGGVAFTHSNQVYLGTGMNQFVKPRRDWWMYNGAYNLDGFLIYPNPIAQGVLKFETSFLEDTYAYAILSVDGRILKEGYGEFWENTIDVSELADGIYLFKYTSATISSTVKFVKR